MARKRRSSSRRKRTTARRSTRRVKRKAPVIRSRRRRSSRRRSNRSAVVVRARRSRRSSRRVSRRSSRRRSGGGIGGSITLRSLMDKQTLQLAGGAVGSSLITGLVINRFGSMLPGLTGANATPWAAVAYQLLIPFGGAYLLRKHAPHVAKGILIGGVASAIQSTLAITGIQNQINALVAPSATTAGTSEYLDATRGVSALPPGYDAVDAFGASPYQSDSAFASSAW